MNEDFKTWLSDQSLTKKTQSVQLSQANRLEKHYGDLDALYDTDGFKALRTELEYSKDDERQGRLNPSKFDIDGDLYANLASYRATLSYYSRFRMASAPPDGANPRRAHIDRAALERLKATFLRRYPDFERLGFGASEGSYWEDERSYKETVLAGAASLVADKPVTDQALGEGMLALLQQPPANFVGWRAFADIKYGGEPAQSAVATALGEMLNDPDEVATVAAACAEKIHDRFKSQALARSLISTALALTRPDEAIAFKTRYLQRAARALMGRGLVTSGVMTALEYRDILSFGEAIFAVMRDEWTWNPKDLWDVQGFLWAMFETTADDKEEDEDERATSMIANGVTPPTNLILYGPPGTGKTYVTAERAVQLCDGALPPGGRRAVMTRYRELVARKRISFVTFHQSYAYEDFVEGLRPETGGHDEADGPSSGGFSLRPHLGVFRKIAELARDNHGRAKSSIAVSPRRQIFKMSLGRSWEEEGTRIFREALDGGYVVLGYGGEIDWTAPQFDDFAAIKARWQQDHPNATGNDPNVQQLWALRSGMQIGDLVVISDGNKKFRAIGEITGPYRFVPGFQREYNHRRSVRWLWHNDQGHPREWIYGRRFSQVSAYQLDAAQVDWPALEQIISGGGEAAETIGAPEAFVLIIDEINRANVSKVFGELITLIEPDKRLGGDNALTVTLPYSGDPFGVPPNLHIVATMNTADRSIALLDTALRRRFQFEELMPDPSALDNASQATGVDLGSVLMGLNSRIEYLFDRDHQIGHAFFIDCKDTDDVAQVMRTKVIPLLAEYFYEDWEKVRQVLGEVDDAGAFVSRTRLKPPKGRDADETDEGRWRYSVRSDYPLSAYEQLKP